MKWAKYCAFVFIGVIALEGFARLEDFLRWGAPLTHSYTIANLSYADAQTFRCRPNAHFKKFELDANGFRTIAGDRPSTHDKAMLLGASESFGLYESPGMEFASVLQKKLTRDGKNWNVLNASCLGMSLPRVTEFLKVHGQTFAPSKILLYPTPHFYLGNKPPSNVPPRLDQQNQPEGKVLHLRFLTKFVDVLKDFMPAALNNYLREFAIQRAQKGKPADWIWQQPPADRLAIFAADLEAFIEVATKLTGDVTLMTHANAFSSTNNETTYNQWRRFYPRAGGTTLIDFDTQANNAIRNIAQKSSLGLVDISSIVVADEDFADFSHFTDTGAAKAAAAIRSSFD